MTAIRNPFVGNPWRSTLIGGAAAAGLLPWAALANPVGAQVTAGEIGFATPDAQTLTVTQSSATAVIDWQDFSIGAGESVIFDQPSASAAVLNRVVGNVASDIQGRLAGNGRVLLINPRGILFGETATVDVGGLVASTLDIADADFLDGRYVFTGDAASEAGIDQAGTMTASPQGMVVLVASRVDNSGLIRARLGQVLLASGSALTLELGDGLVSYTLDDASTAELAGVRNLSGGAIEADGGRVWLSARVAQSLQASVVNNSGRVSAQSIAESGGEIYLLAQGGGVENGGRLDVSANESDARGLVRLQGDGGTSLRGTLDIGSGGALQLAAHDVRIGAGADCVETLCESLLESQLQQGVDVELTASNALVIAALDGGLLDGRASVAGAHGGSLALYALGQGLAIAQDDIDNRIELDGAFLASTADGSGGSIQLGAILSADAIGIDAGLYGRLDAGLLNVHNASGSAQLRVYAGEGMQLAAIDVEGHQTGAVSDGFESLAAARVLIGSTNGDIHISGPVRVSGRIENAAVGDRTVVDGAGLRLAAEFAGIRIDGAVDVDGSVGSVQGGDELIVRGATVELIAGSGSAVIADRLDLKGEIGEITNTGRDALAQGANLSLSSHLGDSRLGGVTALQGSIGTAQAGDFASLSGALIDVSSEFGNVEVMGALSVDAQVGTVDAGRGSEVVGADASFGAVGSSDERFTADAEGSPFGGIRFAGDARFTGDIGSVSSGEFTGVFGVFLFSQAGFDNRIDGALTLAGSIGRAETGDSAYLLGAFGTLLSEGGELGLGSAQVDGRISASMTGDFSQLTGAALWLDTLGSHLEVGGAVTVDGQIADLQSGHTVDASGSYLYLNSLFGRSRLGGAVSVLGSIDGLQADSGQATGAQLLTGSGFSEGYGTDLQIDGDILQRGTLVGITFADAETSSSFLGSVLLDAGSYGLSFADIRADNLFAYFDSDSTIGDSRLDIGGYAELFSASVQPTLAGGSLDIHAGQLFLSANTDLATLTATTTGDLTVFFSDVGATALRLSAGGDLQLAAANLEGDTVVLDGASLYSDAESRIEAGSLAAGATNTILLQGPIRVGNGTALDQGDAELLRRLALVAPELLPESSRPNASFSAPTVGLADLSMAGDFLHIRSDFLFLGALRFAEPGSFVHLEPRLNLPLFAESVDASLLGGQASKLPLNRERIQPNIGSLSSVLGELPQTGGDSQRAGAQLNFVVGEQLPSLGELILDSGLRDSTLVIGGSQYRASIQISDQLAVDVRPSSTNFVLLTSAGILGSDRIQTAGRVVVLGGTEFTDREAFYRQAADEINSFYENLGEDPSDAEKKDGEAKTEQDDAEKQSCEAAS